MDFKMAYQSVFESGVAVFLEALFRGANGVPYYEKQSYRNDFDLIVLDRVIKDMRFYNLSLPVSVNVSPSLLLNKKAVDYIKRVVDPSKIFIEIVEGNYPKDLERLKCKISNLKKFGLRISMDDFGHDEDDLDRLLFLGIEHVKLDMSLVRNIQNDSKKLTKLHTTIECLKKFGIKSVVYEGVEEKAQYEIIKSIDASNVIQGYYYSRPMLMF